jgi:hypothetical protein
MDSQGEITLMEKPKNLGDKPLPVPLHSPQIPHGMMKA